MILTYIVLFIAAICIEIGSTKYIQAVNDKHIKKVMFWSFISPFLSLPFLILVINEPTLITRIAMAFFYGSGYAVGGYIVMKYFNKI